MKQALGQAAIEAVENHYGMDYDGKMHEMYILREAFEAGAEWQAMQSPWISVNKRMPEENDNVIIMCKHGAIFNGTYCNGVWFCMDGYLHDTYKGNPIYSSMTGIPPLWEPIAWMPIPKFND